MAINRNTPATVLVVGYVDRISEQRKREDRALYAHDLTIETESGGKLAARVWIRDGAPAVPVPSVGEFVAYMASVSERRGQDGTLRTELHVQRAVTADDADKLNSLTSATAAA